MEKKRVSFRLEEVYLKMLDKLGSNRTEELRVAIMAEFERVHGKGSAVEFIQQNKESVR